MQGSVKNVAEDTKTRGSVNAVIKIYKSLPERRRGEGPFSRSPASLVHGSGLNVFFRALVQMAKMQKGKQLIIALATYWWDVTHTFHFKWGEATITPADYGAITGLPFKGRQIEWYDDYTATELDRLLGFESKPRKGFGMTFSHVQKNLEEMIRKYNAGDMTVEPEQIARSFMWFGFCSTLFGRAEGTCMFSLLKSLEDLDKAEGYAWGEAGLAETYFALDNYTRLGQTSLYCFEFAIEVHSYSLCSLQHFLFSTPLRIHKCIVTLFCFHFRSGSWSSSTRFPGIDLGTLCGITPPSGVGPLTLGSQVGPRPVPPSTSGRQSTSLSTRPQRQCSSFRGGSFGMIGIFLWVAT